MPNIKRLFSLLNRNKYLVLKFLVCNHKYENQRTYFENKSSSIVELWIPETFVSPMYILCCCFVCCCFVCCCFCYCKCVVVLLVVTPNPYFDPDNLSEAPRSCRPQHYDHDHQDEGVWSAYAGDGREAKRIISMRNLVVPKVPNAFQEDRCHFEDLLPSRICYF